MHRLPLVFVIALTSCAARTPVTAAVPEPAAAPPRVPADATVKATPQPATAAMTAGRAKEVIAEVGTQVEDSGNVVQFKAAEVPMALVVDVQADRMRIVSAIAETKDYGIDELNVLLAANYHSALDARYAVSDGVVYAAFIHPLSPLSEPELVSGIVQVANLVRTYGSTFSSTGVVFGLGTDDGRGT